MSLLSLVMRTEMWFAGVVLSHLAQKVKRTPEVFQGLMDPLGSAQVQNGILTCFRFPKGTTEVLKGPRLSWHLEYSPGTPGNLVASNAITITHPSTCYFSVTMRRGRLQWWGRSSSVEKHWHATLKIRFHIFWNTNSNLVYFVYFQNQTIQNPPNGKLLKFHLDLTKP